MKKYLLFAMVLFSLFIVSPKAATLSNNSYFVKVDNHDMPYQTGVGAGGYIRPAIQFYNLSENDVLTAKFNYLILDVCTGSPFGSSNVTIENNGTANYFDSNSLVIYNTNMTCSLGNGYNGVLYKAQMRVGKYVDSEGDGLYAASYLKVINTYGYYTITTFSSAVVSDEDVLTGLAQNNITNDLQRDILNQQKEFNKKQDQTNSKLDDVKGKQDEAEKTRKGILGTIKDVLSNIINLPKKIVEFLVDALKSLFVPTDDQLYEIVNDSKELSENFGFVGEAVAFFLNIFTGLLGMVNANGCIEMPAFKIGATSLFDEHTFWDARNVCLADNTILSANIDTIRAITSIAFVSLFLGFAASKFFGILSKNDSGTSMTYDENDNSFTVNDWSRTNGITYNRRYKS